ncbi:preprotein translocase subunit SecD, partial [archaeon CG_4_10_14_0_2_um_filter_Archaea_38_6]
KDKIKRAFFIVFATFTISIAVMLPLIWAGAGILRGFAITTIIAISVGVFITRPAYARILELIVKRD